MKEKRHIEVVPYDPSWPIVFEDEAKLIQTALGAECLAVYHVGSTSVPGLSAKPKIDIIAVLKDDPALSIPVFEAIGYEYRGEWNIPLHFGFRKRVGENVNLHVYRQGHPEIELNLMFRDYLRSHPDVRDAYGALKLKLLENEASFVKNNSIFTGYTLGKGSFIWEVLKKAGFNRLRFLHCVHHAEWDAAKAMRRRYFFPDKADPYEWTVLHSDHRHFVLTKGIDVVGYAHVQLWPDSRAALRIIVIDETHRHQGLGRHLLSQIETWLTGQRIKSLHTESSPNALAFYEKMGYRPAPFNDPDGRETDARDISLSKIIS